MGMMNVPEMRRIYRVQRFDFWVAIAAIVGDPAVRRSGRVVIGIGLSLLWLDAGRHPSAHRHLLGREPGTQVFRDWASTRTTNRFPGVVVLRLDGGLFFATSDALEDRIRDVALSSSGIAAIVLDCGGVEFIDSQGSAKLREVAELTGQAGVTLRLARVKPTVLDLLGRDGVVERIGADKIHPNVAQAVSTQLASTGAPHKRLPFRSFRAIGYRSMWATENPGKGRGSRQHGLIDQVYVRHRRPRAPRCCSR